MADDDDFDDDEPDLDDEVDIDEDEEDDALDLDVDAVVADDVDELEGDDEPVVAERAERKGTRSSEEGTDEEDDDVVDLEEELHPDDVEEPLDVLLHEKTSSDRLEEEAIELEDEELEPDDRGEGTGRVVPRRDDEFLCRSCFLVKPLSQLARGEKNLCRDCE